MMVGFHTNPVSRLLLAVVLSVGSVPLTAQKLYENIHFEHIPVPGTIHSSLTEDITRDEYGMMWIAKDALYRYDGRDFRKYDLILNDSTGFSPREISILTWDSLSHRLLIGTRNFGVVQYSYETDKLTRLPSKDGTPIVSDIAQTTDGIIVTSMTSGIFMLVNDTLVKAELPPDIRWPSEIVKGNGVVWISCQNEIIALRDRQVVHRLKFDDLRAFSNRNVRASCMAFDNKGNLWVGTERDGIVVLDTASRKVVRKFQPNQPPFYNPIVKIAQDNESLVWIATKGDGLIIYNPSDNSHRQILSNDRTTGSISGDHCTSIFMDPSGTVWVGAAGDINKYDRQQIKFSHYSHNPYEVNTLSDDNIRNVYFDGPDIIYACTSGGFMNIIDRASGRIQRVKPNVSSGNSFVAPMCVVRFDDNNLLVATTAGLLRYHTPSRSFKYFEPLERMTRGNHMRQIIRHNDNFHMLVGGNLVTYKSDKKEIVNYGNDPAIGYGSALAVDDKGRLWAGVQTGVSYSDAAQKSFSLIPLGQDIARPDSSFFLALSLQQMGDEMWVNSFNNGVYVIDLRSNPPRLIDRITTRSGLADNTVYATIPDGLGNVWITHNSGLSRYELKTRKFVHFTVSEGLQGDEFNRLAFSVNSRGEIAVGGTNGINVFDPGKIKIASTPKQVRLVDLTAFALRRYDDEPIYASLLNGASEVRVPHDFNSLRFSFLVPDYQEPARFSIQHRLEPFDNDWVETNRLTTPVYSNLLPGTYDFSVKVAAFTGDEIVSSVRVYIRPPYWQTWWFLGLAAIVVSFLVYSIIYSRIQATKRETQRLEELLKSRTREIEQSREELQNLNRKKDLIFSILSHDLRSPLTTLKGFLSLLIDNSDALTKDELQKYATNIRNSVTTSLDLIDNTLFWSLSQTGNIHCSPGQVQVGLIFDKIRDLYHLTAEKKRLTITFGTVNGLAVYADENMVYVLLRNLVSNAIKFTPETNSIIVDAVRQGALVSIRIKDHGVGMTKQEIDNIFTLDNPIVKKGTSSEKGTGLGLLLCKKFVELNHGQLLIESKPGEGSSFTVLLPSA
jgi:signal transduction histidine kinase/ligand-binding sensor domain-containing protein